MPRALFSLLLLVASVGHVVASAAAERPAAPAAADRPVNFSVTALGACLDRRPPDSCLDALTRDALVRHTTAHLLAELRRHQDADPRIRLGCHPVAHAIGRETYRIKGTIHDAFGVCDQTCHSGCYHGVVERFLTGDSATTMAGGHVSIDDVQRKAREACDPRVPDRLRFQCLHGLGHAVLYFTGYALDRALDVCNALDGAWNQRSCYGGVFMENLFSASPERRDISTTDYHYPCSRLSGRYRADCYLIQTWRMGEMGLSTEELFSQCKLAGAERRQCVQSIGRDLSNDVRLRGPESTARTCERRSSADRRSCIRGAVYALADNTWDDRYARPFCDALTFPEDRTFCRRITSRYVGRFQKR